MGRSFGHRGEEAWNTIDLKSLGSIATFKIKAKQL